MTDGVAVLCSFCGKSNDDVRTIIRGDQAAICDECVDVCVGTLVRKGYGRRHFWRWWRRLWAYP